MLPDKVAERAVLVMDKDPALSWRFSFAVALVLALAGTARATVLSAAKAATPTTAVRR
jgi:hypothetical protein